MPKTADERPGRLLGDLASDYRKHLDQYETWLSLARRANAKLDEGEIDEFLQIHEEKQRISEGLREEESRLRNHRDAVQRKFGLARFTVRELEGAENLFDDEGTFALALADWRDLLDELSRAMREVAKAEKQTEQKLQRHLGSLSGAMSEARSTRRAVKEYNRPDADEHEARFIDRRG